MIYFRKSGIHPKFDLLVYLFSEYIHNCIINNQTTIYKYLLFQSQMSYYFIGKTGSFLEIFILFDEKKNSLLNIGRVFSFRLLEKLVNREYLCSI